MNLNLDNNRINFNTKVRQLLNVEEFILFM